MNFIEKYDDKHIKFYLNWVPILNKKNVIIDEWIKSISESEILIWIRILYLIKKNDNNMHYHNLVVATTHIIHLFLVELDVDINMVNSFNKEFIEILINRFNNIILYEYAYRRKYVNNKKNYTLLKEIRW